MIWREKSGPLRLNVSTDIMLSVTKVGWPALLFTTWQFPAVCAGNAEGTANSGQLPG